MQHGIVSNGTAPGGTAPGGTALRAVWPSTGTTPRVEVLGFGGCPNTPKMRDRVAEAAGALGAGYVLVEVDQKSLGVGDLRRGYPAPTVLVDGVDLFGLPVPSSLAMGCRVYPGGLPSAEEIQSRLAAFSGDGRGDLVGSADNPEGLGRVRNRPDLSAIGGR